MTTGWRSDDNGLALGMTTGLALEMTRHRDECDSSPPPALRAGSARNDNPLHYARLETSPRFAKPAIASAARNASA
jgi:hypothetical protein